MLSDGAWANPGNNPGINGMDRACFFADVPSSYNSYCQEAMTVVNSKIPLAPYPGGGNFGVALHIGPSSKCWRYHQMNSGGELCASAHDGFKCGPLAAWRLPVTSKTYDWFQSQKKAVLAQFTGHNYNEFDVNGMSSSDLAGVFLNGKQSIDESKMCHFLRKANPDRSKPWPVYSYSFNTLILEQYICGSDANIVV